MLSEHFKKKYLHHLENAYTLYYDDLSEYGNPLTATEVLYFIPGTDGVPGQIRFILPSLLRHFGKNIYIKCLYLDEYSASRPVWEKYTIANCNRRKETIIQDLLTLAKRHAHINVLTYSNGFYDFLHTSNELAHIHKQLTLHWTACAPDRLGPPNRWLKQIYKLNGFQHEGYSWLAFPCNNQLAWLNPEMTTTYLWKRGKQHRIFYKHDLVTRFKVMKLYWNYVSLDAFNACLEWSLRDFKKPLNLTSYVLVAGKDGYWAGVKIDKIIETIEKYLANPKVLVKPSSHSWAAEPNNMSDFLNFAKHSLSPLNSKQKMMLPATFDEAIME